MSRPLDDVARITGLQTNAAGQPFLDPADNRVFAATSNGERHAHDGEMYTLGANFGLPVGPGFINLTAEYRHRNPTNRAGYDLRPNYNRPTAAFDARELTLRPARVPLRRRRRPRTINLFVNAGMPLGAGGWELYGFGSYGHRDGLSAANYRQQSAAANRDYGTLAPGQTPTAANFVPLTPDGFLPFIDTNLEDYAGTLGMRGELGGWNTDLSVGYGHNSFDYIVRNTLNTSFGTASQSVFDAGGLRYGQLVANLDFSREYRDRPREPAFGRGRRRISQREFPDPAGRPPILCHRPAVPRLLRDHRGQLRGAGRRLQCRHRHLQLPGPGRAGRRPGLPAASPPPARPTKAGTATRPMSSSTPTRSRASPSRSPAASSISPISATR